MRTSVVCLLFAVGLFVSTDAQNNQGNGNSNGNGNGNNNGGNNNGGGNNQNGNGQTNSGTEPNPGGPSATQCWYCFDDGGNFVTAIRQTGNPNTGAPPRPYGRCRRYVGTDDDECQGIGDHVFDEPHVKQRLRGSDIPFCYDIFGQNGDIFKLYEDANTGFRLNTELAQADFHPEYEEGKYVGRVGIISGSDVIIVDLDGAVIHRKKAQDLQLPWNTQIFANLTNSQIRVQGEKMKLEFPGIVSLSLNKMHASYFDMDIAYKTTMGEQSSGIMGDIGNSVSFEGEMALLNLPDGTSPRFSTFYHTERKCLKMKRGYEQLDQFILENRVPCIMC